MEKYLKLKVDPVLDPITAVARMEHTRMQADYLLESI
jgi:hypothetical protein